MSFQVTIKPSNRVFTADEGESVIEAAMRNGITLPYGCRNGACGSCKGKLLEGRVNYGQYAGHILPEYEKKAGFALFCQAKPLSDIVIEAREINAVGQIQIKKLPCRVQKIERPSDDVAALTLSLPANERLQFLAGQYIEIILRDGKRRAYSMANSPEDDAHIELHVRRMASGAFTEYVFTKMKEKDILRFEGPLGTFFLREDSDKPMVLVASGTGFAPIKSLVQHAFHTSVTREMVLYWGGRRPADLYMHQLCLDWQRDHAYVLDPERQQFVGEVGRRQFPGVGGAPEGDGEQEDGVPERAADAAVPEGVYRQRQQNRRADGERQQAEWHGPSPS